MGSGVQNTATRYGSPVSFRSFENKIVSFTLIARVKNSMSVKRFAVSIKTRTISDVKTKAQAQFRLVSLETSSFMATLSRPTHEASFFGWRCLDIVRVFLVCLCIIGTAP